MAEPFIGEIRIFPYNFAPTNWAKCEGQLLQISSQSALYSLVGTTYGGNGTTTFGVPDFRGRVPMNWGNPGWASYAWGAKGGVESHILPKVPPHRHTMQVMAVDGDQTDPAGQMIASQVVVTPTNTEIPFSSTANTTLHPNMVGTAGGAPAAFTNIQPVTALNFCIALTGIYPPRS